MSASKQLRYCVEMLQLQPCKCPRADPSFTVDKRAKRILRWVQRCVLMLVCSGPSNAMLLRADLLRRTASVCVRPALTSQAQTQAAVFPRSCSSRSRRLLTGTTASLTRGQRRSVSEELVPSRCHRRLRCRLQHGRVAAIQQPRYTEIYTGKNVLYSVIQRTRIVPHGL